MCEVKDTLLCTGDGLPREGGGRGSALVLPFDRPRVVGSRQAFVRALLHLVESALKQGKNAGGAAGSIAFHWGASFESADLAARQATFQLAGGKTVTRGYDLLVGADGYWSRVRRAMEKQVPGMRITVVPPNRQYKVVRGLRPVECLRLGPSGASPGRLCMVKEAAAAAKASGGPPGNWFMSQLSEVAGVTAVLSMPHTRWQKLEGAGAAEWMAFLRSAYPSMPDSWTEEVRILLLVLSPLLPLRRCRRLQKACFAAVKWLW